MTDPAAKKAFRERALPIALTWLGMATAHRLFVLGRYEVAVSGIYGREAVGLEGRMLPLAVANGMATDLCSFVLLVGPTLVVAHLAQRANRPIRLMGAGLPWIATGILTIGLLFNFLAFRHTGRALDFLLLSNFSRGSDLWRFVQIEGGGPLRLMISLCLAASVPFIVASVASRTVKLTLPTLSWRLIAFLLVAVAIYAVTAPARGASIASQRGRMAFTMIREYEDPLWRMATGAIWARRSPTIRREITQEEFRYLRPVLTPLDPSPAIDPRYPIFRTLADARPRAIEVPAPAELPNVVLVLLEGNGTADLGAFGDPAGLTPCFDGLAKEGLLFESYYSNASDSVGAFYSILSSAYPDIDASRANLVPIRGSLPDVLNANGYSSAIVASDWNKLTDLAKGMEFERIQVSADSWGDDRAVFARAGARAAAMATKGPYFLTVFTVTHHSPWVLADGSGKRGVSEWERSRETLAYQDRALCDFVKELRTQESGSRRTLLVLAGDHGSHIPPGGITDLSGLPEHAIHVPLLLHAPGWIPARRSDILGSHVDVLPTILDVLGIAGAETATVGSSLLRGGQKRVFATTSTGAGYIGLLRGDRKLVHDVFRGSTRTYRLGSDEPAETDPATVERMLGETHLINRFATWLVLRRAVAPPYGEPTSGARPE